MTTPVRLVDAHVHFWDRGNLAYSWLDPLPQIAAPHLPETLAQETGTARPDRIVFVQAGSDPTQGLAEARWIESLASREPRIAGIVAFAPMDEGARTRDAIAALAELPLVRGVRHNVQDDPGFADGPGEAFIAGVRELGARGLSFDHCCKHHQLRATLELARRCPETTFILDHGGKPDIRAGRLDPWREHIQELARLPNVRCKLSGLVTEADHASWTPEQIRPYAEHLIASFGPARLMFGSDWPVVKLASPYRRWLDLAREFTGSLSADERAAIFHETARQVYRLS